jgi:predicted secreted hydrolase
MGNMALAGAWITVRARLGLALAALLVLGGLAWGAWELASPAEDPRLQATLSPVGILAGDDTAGYARAVEPREFDFPRDHGPHPEYRTEWWYVTGHLEGAEGREFAFQLTFFRAALAPGLPDRESAWNTNQLWMGHLGLTDVEAGRHQGAERLARGAAGLAGARMWEDGSPLLHLWVEDWEMVSGEDGLFPLRIQAREEDRGLNLTLREGKPPVFQGEDGLSRKGPDPGNASYYYTFPRMPAEGTLEIRGRTFHVQGEAWIDREWSTSALDEDQVGWDWFSVQLSDDRELMFFELRRRDGTVDTLNHGSLVAPDGSWEVLGHGDVEVTVLDWWESPLDGARYPSGWRLRIPDRGVDLRLDPVIRDQEMNLSFRYWEGAVRVEGEGVDGPVRGRGFVEMTGYGEEVEERGERGASTRPGGGS